MNERHCHETRARGSKPRAAVWLVAAAIGASPPTEAALVRHYWVLDTARPTDHDVALWDTRLRRWLEDRRVPVATTSTRLSMEAARPWRELAEEKGRPWERLGCPLARERAVRAAWTAFRGGRTKDTTELLAHAGRRGVAVPLGLPWEWSDPEAFAPEAEAFAAKLRGSVVPRCDWKDPEAEARWVDGASVESTAPIAEGVHAIVRVLDGRWQSGTLRCAYDGGITVVAQDDRNPALVASDRWPAVVTFWDDGGLRVAWIGSASVAWMSDGPIDASVALDAGGGPLFGLRLPVTAQTFRETVPAPVSANPHTTVEHRQDTATVRGRGGPTWLWLALGTAALVGGGLWLSRRENDRQSFTVPLQWDR